MEIPKDIKLYYHPTTTFWFDKTGILYSVSLPSVRNLEIMTDYVSFVKNITNDKKVCILSDISNASTMDKVARDYMQTELKNLYKAMAVIAKTPLSKMIGNIYFKMNPRSFPSKIFSNENDAKEWLTEYI